MGFFSVNWIEDQNSYVNIQVLGLLLENHVEDLEKLEQIKLRYR